jgi:hypothetical protein
MNRAVLDGAVAEARYTANRIEGQPSPKMALISGTSKAVSSAFNPMPNPEKAPASSLCWKARAVP